MGSEDPLEKEMTTHSNILAWEIPWIEEQAGYSWGLQATVHGVAESQTRLSDLTTTTRNNEVFISSYLRVRLGSRHGEA